jgi:hypothetical protein
MHAISSGEEDRAPSDLDRTAAYRFGCEWPGQAADLGRPGRRLPLRPAFLFFSANRFSFFQNACKVHKCVEIILGIQNLYFKFL